MKIFGYYDQFNDYVYRGKDALEKAEKAIKGGNTVVPIFVGNNERIKPMNDALDLEAVE